MSNKKFADTLAVGAIWEHTKTNGKYVIVGYCQLEAEWKPAILYANVDGTTELPIARSVEEFTDGRFVYKGRGNPNGTA